MTDDVKMPEENRARCAHLTVKYRTIPVDDMAVRGEWNCTDCGYPFRPDLATRPAQEAIAIQAAFMEGFARSAEGWNGEYGATIKQVEEEAARYLANTRPATQDAKVERLVEALGPFIKFTNSLKEWKTGRSFISRQEAHPKHKPVLRRTYPCDEETMRVVELWVDDFINLEQALRDWRDEGEKDV